MLHRTSLPFVTAVLGLLTTACDSGSSPTAPPAPPAAPTRLDQSVETATTVFRFALGDAVEAPRQEAFNAWISSETGVALRGKLQYLKYRDRSHLQQMTGWVTNGRAVPEQLTVHSITPWDAHETAHVYTLQLGEPSDYFIEGIAVALTVDPLNRDFQPRWSNERLHNYVRGRPEMVLPLASIVTRDEFRAISETDAYPQAGSFVRFLIDEHGIDRVLELFRRGDRGDSLATIEATFGEIFGRPLATAERDWRVFLGLPD